MAERAERGIHARVFDAIADDYERHRPAYPDALVNRACEVAGLGPGATVLEIGCGTGQLTRSLVAHGLRVTAVEPGAQLIGRARTQLQDAGELQFINARLEEALLPRSHYRAVFAASAIHWADPDVSWRKLADALPEGGTLALLSYFGFHEPYSEDDQRVLRAAVATVAPELAANWPIYRDLKAIRAGAAERRENVSELWGWLGSYKIAHSDAARLFEEAELAAVPRRFEHTADQLNALLGTMSFWARLSRRQREALSAANYAVNERLGRPIRSSTLACMVTARRRRES